MSPEVQPAASTSAPASPPHEDLFNVVILPVSPVALAPRLYQLSATRNDRALRLISPHWSEPQLRAAFGLIDTPNLHIEQLLRGNRMAHGGRDTRKLFFTAEQLETMGLAPAPELPAPELPAPELPAPDPSEPDPSEPTQDQASL